jgi:hypothetical protein
VEIQPAETLTLAGRTLESQGVGDPFAEHLQAAADSDQLAAIAQMTLEVVRPPPLAKPREIGTHCLRTRQNDQIGAGKACGLLCVTKIDLRVRSERIEVRMVGNSRQHGYHD